MFLFLDVAIKMVTSHGSSSWLMANGSWLMAQGSLLGWSVCMYVVSSSFCREHVCAHSICVQVALRAGFADLAKALDGKKGIITQIKTTKAALKDEDMSQFDKHPDVVVQALTVFSKEVSEQASKIDSCRKNDIGPLQMCS